MFRKILSFPPYFIFFSEICINFPIYMRWINYSQQDILMALSLYFSVNLSYLYPLRERISLSVTLLYILSWKMYLRYSIWKGKKLEGLLENDTIYQDKLRELKEMPINEYFEKRNQLDECKRKYKEDISIWKFIFRNI